MMVVNSAAGKAAQVGRGRLWQRALAGVGYITPGYAQAQREARQWGAGSVGEAWTKAMLQPLTAQGWHMLHDRSIPGMGQANLDHLLITPSATALMVDSKMWNRRTVVCWEQGRLLHDGRDKTGEAVKARDMADRVGRLLGVPVAAVLAVHVAPVAGGGFQADGVAVLPADRLVAELRQIAGRRDPEAARQLAAKADRLLPPYVEGRSK